MLQSVTFTSHFFSPKMSRFALFYQLFKNCRMPSLSRSCVAGLMTRLTSTATTSRSTT